MPFSSPVSQPGVATTRSAMTVWLIHSSTVCRKLWIMMPTPIMIAIPIMSADTVMAFRPGARAICSAAIRPSAPTRRRPVITVPTP
jgi:hypothetical protein